MGEFKGYQTCSSDQDGVCDSAGRSVWSAAGDFSKLVSLIRPVLDV